MAYSTAWLDSVDELFDSVSREERASGVKFTRRTITAGFGSDGIFGRISNKEVVWEERNVSRDSAMDCDNGISFSGVPFLIIGRLMLECCYGSKRVVNSNADHNVNDHTYRRQKYRKLQNTRKLGCPARVHVKEILLFPDFAITSNTKARRSAMSSRLRAALQQDVHSLTVRRSFVVRMCSADGHQNHYLGPLCTTCLPTDSRVMSKMKELAAAGVRRVPEMQRHVKQYVEHDLFGDQNIPPLSDARFWPNGKVIMNVIYRTRQKTRSGDSDEENAGQLVEQLKLDNTDDHIVLNVGDLGGDGASPVVFASQTSWQKKMLQLYGSEMCLIDATYRTTVYDLPLFALCVLTNVGYVNVASFILSDERQESIVAGLRQIAAWNTDWQPTEFMSDFHEGQISAVESVFPAACVRLCKFHRIQAWNRHLVRHENKDKLLSMLEIVAGSMTISEFEDNLHEVLEYDCSVQSWLEQKWLPHRHRWVQAFQTGVLNALVTTTNGLERQHEQLKYAHLSDVSNGSLTDVIKTVVKSYIPSCQQRYEQMNVRCLDTVRRYDSSVPCFLRNRPPFFLSHCLRRISANTTPTPSGSIVESESGMFTVASSNTANSSYVVRLHSETNSDVPSCECRDWSRHCLPCKHMLAVIMRHSGTDGWDSLPCRYRNLPQFNLDPEIVAASGHCALQTELDRSPVAPVILEEEDTVPPDVQCSPSAGDVGHSSVTGNVTDSAQRSGVDESRSRLRQTLSLLINCTYTIDDDHFLRSALESAKTQLQAFKQHSSDSTKRLLFRHNRRLVKSSIIANGLRRRLAVVRAKRRQRQRQRKLRAPASFNSVIGQLPPQGSEATQFPRLPQVSQPFGLRNFGNTCFMNSVVQMLRSATAVTRSIECHVASHNMTECVSCCVGHAVRGSPRPLNCIVNSKGGKRLQRYTHGVEYDAHEFLLYLLSNIAEESRIHHELQEVEQSLMLETSCTVRCTGCGIERDVNEKSTVLSLCVPQLTSAVRLSGIIADTLSSELITVDCPSSSCTGKSAESILAWHTCPQVLILHLLRWRTIQQDKVSTDVVVDDVLQVHNNSQTAVQYSLTAVVLHIGESVSSGHYVTFIKRDDDWLIFDDNQVSLVHCRPHVVDGAHVYMCIYTRQGVESSSAVLETRSKAADVQPRSTQSYNLRRKPAQKRFSASWQMSVRKRPKRHQPPAVFLDEDDTVDNVMETTQVCPDDGLPDSSSVYAPVRAFVPPELWQYCPNKFLDCAVVGTHAADDQLQIEFPNKFPNTFVIPVCVRQPDYHSNSSLVNRLHDSVPVQIFVAMIAAGVIDSLERKTMNTDTFSDMFC